MRQPTTRLSGTFTGLWAETDGADVLLHGVLTTRTGHGVRVDHEITLAIDPDLVPFVCEQLDQARDQVCAASSAIDDHDVAVDERLIDGLVA